MIRTIASPWSSKLLLSALLLFGAIVPWPLQALNVIFFSSLAIFCTLLKEEEFFSLCDVAQLFCASPQPKQPSGLFRDEPVALAGELAPGVGRVAQVH